MSLRCVIVDDSPALLRAAGALLDSEGMTIVGVAGGIDEALSVVDAQSPDVVLVDIDLGAESGFELTRRLATPLARSGACSILISTHDEADYAPLISASPAIGFLAKSELSAAAIHRMVNRVHGESPAEPEGT
jgi:DNA-binding NarL/FixJ family response regulator